MFVLVTGGSGSGKSACAEQRILEFGERPRSYIATMMCFDEESRERIRRHRLMRRDKGFETIECYQKLSDVRVPRGGAVLLECMSNLIANELYAEGGAGEDTVNAVMSGIRSLLAQTDHLVVVTNEVFSDGITYDPETMRYLEYLGRVNREMAALSDETVEVVYGIPVSVKGRADKV